MPIKKTIDVKLLVSALIISAIIFIAGVSVGYGVNKEKLSLIEQDMNNIVADVQNFQLQTLFIEVLGEDSTCPFLVSTLQGINDRSYGIGSRLDSVDSEGEVLDFNEYSKLKKEYSRLLVGYWLIAEKLKDSCNLNASTIIYFYSSRCDRCPDQAFILTHLKRLYEENLLVFALDSELDEPSIKTIMAHYGVDEFPTLIVDDLVLPGFHSKETLTKLIDL